MITIKNDTGHSNHTRIFDEAGNDITAALSIYKIEVDITVDRELTALLHCHLGEIDFEKVVVNNEPSTPGGHHNIQRLHNYFEMKKAGFDRIN
jgi:hypothetical protein